jgi:asparagine synthase (glutamine-hydrolysing)
MEEIAAIYEQWEWQERQAKWVVNGQRLYDFMGFKWELPLWDGELTKFWATVPLNQRLKQSLFIDYLDDFNYKGLFKGYSSEARRWPHQLEFIMNVAYVLSKILKTNPDTFQKYASYWGHYADQYSLFGLKYFLQNIGKATVPPQGRGAIALGVTHWIKENSLQD